MKSVTRKLGLLLRFLSRSQLQTQSAAVISLPLLWNLTPVLDLDRGRQAVFTELGITFRQQGSITPIS